MSKVICGRWDSGHNGQSRKGCRSCEYEAYVPDPLAGGIFPLDGAVATSGGRG